MAVTYVSEVFSVSVNIKIGLKRYDNSMNNSLILKESRDRLYFVNVGF